MPGGNLLKLNDGVHFAYTRWTGDFGFGGSEWDFQESAPGY
jgi:hypothetical protein